MEDFFFKESLDLKELKLRLNLVLKDGRVGFSKVADPLPVALLKVN